VSPRKLVLDGAVSCVKITEPILSCGGLRWFAVFKPTASQLRVQVNGTGGYMGVTRFHCKPRKRLETFQNVDNVFLNNMCFNTRCTLRYVLFRYELTLISLS